MTGQIYIEKPAYRHKERDESEKLGRFGPEWLPRLRRQL
jgi:hypothetical protein